MTGRASEAARASASNDAVRARASGLRRRHPALHPKGVMASPGNSATTLASGSAAEPTGSSS